VGLSASGAQIGVRRGQQADTQRHSRIHAYRRHVHTHAHAVGYRHARATATYASAGHFDGYALAHALDPTHALAIDDTDAVGALIW
jgi:hypothetical protein